MKQTFTLLCEKKETTDQVVDKIAGVDKVLDDIEERTDRLQTAREWLAKTETRLEVVSKQAQDHVKLLENLVKAEVTDRKHESGAPPTNKRNTVIKLARQGWSAQEIARVTKLSMGEVELILEIAPSTE